MREVVITGASRGIGLAIATRLSAEGYGVTALARRSSSQLEAAIAEAAAGRHGPIRFLAQDLSDIEAIPDCVKALRAKVGPIFGLINNAGIGTQGLLATMHNSQIEALIKLNVLSPILLTKYVVRHMMADGGGRIVNMGSIIGETGYNGLSVYGATKAAAAGFSRSLAREVGRLGITVNTIAPGFIATEMTQDLDETQRDKIAARSALRRLPEVDDIAAMVAFLLGEGGRNITGAVLTVDAGNTA
jgi:3-oxoacyl-[acyl-carrier protein] reductase